MTRFKVGDRVKVLPIPATPFGGLQGTVHEVLPHDRHITTLDRYLVRFEWGETQLFYDAQLTPIEVKG